MQPPDPGESSSPPGWPPWIKRFVLPYTQESGLMVIWLIVLLQAVMGLSVAQIFAVRDRHPAGILAFLFLILVTVDLVRHDHKWHGKLGGLTATVAACWLASVGLSFLASHYGVF